MDIKEAIEEITRNGRVGIDNIVTILLNEESDEELFLEGIFSRAWKDLIAGSREGWQREGPKKKRKKRKKKAPPTKEIPPELTRQEPQGYTKIERPVITRDPNLIKKAQEYGKRAQELFKLYKQGHKTKREYQQMLYKYVAAEVRSAPDKYRLPFFNKLWTFILTKKPPKVRTMYRPVMLRVKGDLESGVF